MKEENLKDLIKMVLERKLECLERNYKLFRNRFKENG